MIKKILILALLVSIPFFYTKTAPTVIAASSAIEETGGSASFWSQIFNEISSWFSNFFMQVESWFVKENLISCNPKEEFTDYNNADQDANTRAQSISVQKYRKGSYLRAIIDGNYNDSIITYFCNGGCTDEKSSDSCMEVKYSTLVYYFYKKGEKILYDRDNSKTPIDYDSEKMESYQYSIPSNSDSYFRNLYENISQIPSGSYLGEEDEDAAAASSNELNDSLRTFIPKSDQTIKPSSNVFTSGNAKAMAKDNEYQQRAVFANFIPEKSQEKILGVSTDQEGQVLGVSTETEKLKKMFSDYLHPKSWQMDDELFDDEDSLPERESNGACNALKSHCHGMSQWGALGMAMAGFDYEEILRAYYGNIKLIYIQDYTSTALSKLYVQVETQKDDTCSGSNPYKIQLEQYLRGLGEMPSYWGNDGVGGMNALKAQAIAARTYVYTKTQGFQETVCATASCQVFRCSIVGAKPNFDIAVQQTAGLIMADADTGVPFRSQYARSFCGPSISASYKFNNSVHTTPSYDGKSYEELAYKNLGREANLYCK